MQVINWKGRNKEEKNIVCVITENETTSLAFLAPIFREFFASSPREVVMDSFISKDRSADVSDSSVFPNRKKIRELNQRCRLNDKFVFPIYSQLMINYY